MQSLRAEQLECQRVEEVAALPDDVGARWAEDQLLVAGLVRRDWQRYAEKRLHTHRAAVGSSCVCVCFGGIFGKRKKKMTVFCSLLVTEQSKKQRWAGLSATARAR